MNYFVAPLQGYTDAPFRRFHQHLYPSASTHYVAPFLRMEKGQPRLRDIRDITSPLNYGIDLTPQIIFRNPEEFDALVQTLSYLGFSNIDLNMGCPYPMQTRKGRGAATLANLALLEHIAIYASDHPHLRFSAKMRLGLTRNQMLWPKAIDILNHAPLSHITIHPRTADDLYSGSCVIEEVSSIINTSTHPVIYNGDITEPEHIDRIKSMFPSIHGVMIGRGLLMRPSIITEHISGREWTLEQRLEHMLSLHDAIFKHHSQTLCGDTQILTKTKSFWDYSEPFIGHKLAKTIRKTKSLQSYIKLIQQISPQIIAH